MPATLGGVWAPAALRAVRTAAYKASKMLRAKLAAAAARPVEHVALEPVLARGSRQPIHPSALVRQQKSRRWYSSTSAAAARVASGPAKSTSYYQHINAAIRRLMSTGSLAPSIDRCAFRTVTRTGRAIAQSAGRSPWATTLRPNLTGGALPRSASGYGLGSGRLGGVRYFSHGPASPAEVIQSVSAAARAFWISGQRAQFDGLTPRGDPKYRAVSVLEDEATRAMAAVPRSAPGAFVDFRLSPTVTALSPLAAAFPFSSSAKAAGAVSKTTPAFTFDDASTLNTEGFIDVLSIDFARALRDLTATLADVKKLADLGDLPVRLEKGGAVLRVRFPGVDAATVEALCDDLGLTRGIVGEDPEFADDVAVAVALQFPFAPTATALSYGEDDGDGGGFSLRSRRGLPEGFSLLADEENPWLSSPDLEGYETMPPSALSSGEHCSEDFDGLEGIYHFLEECDRAQKRF
ncbi:hypothetical protein GGS23DRAFT_126999 [Durotheca rogersii]|uniref:uncharacterized protein n=1 Tax=Durotheca rogersii TaxID=419775 RepID=UPI00221EFCB4|nr:uncharacterized protein GGS23DRAFT_126999 [Durotheca rogersii]KAI5861709.1 hypothetical protein GGS23DRAFT_126999 [Durotheca rogersii]